jgi:hypothetical protein
MNHGLHRLAGSKPKFRALDVGYRDQGNLYDVSIRDPQKARRLLFVIEVEDSPQVPRPRARAASMKL